MLLLFNQAAAGGAYTLVADGGTYNYSGDNASLIYTPVGSYTLTADGGVHSYSGNNSDLRYSRVLVADSGTYTYSGNNANLLYNRLLAADGGTYSYSGNNANLTYVPFSGVYTIIAEGGVYTYSGNNANLIYTGQQPDAVGGGNPKGYKREYQPYYYELQNRRKIEEKVQEVELDLKATENKIETLEIKRTRDLADEAMQIELVNLLTKQNELMQLIKELQQQKLRVLNDDEEVMMLLMRLIN